MNYQRSCSDSLHYEGFIIIYILLVKCLHSLQSTCLMFSHLRTPTTPKESRTKMRDSPRMVKVKTDWAALESLEHLYLL